MELSKRARDLISRATALAVGLALAYGCVKTVGCILAIQDEAREKAALSNYRPRATVPAIFFLGVAVTGIPAFLLIGYSIVPTRWLYKIDPTPTPFDRDDLDRMTSRVPRW